eukprot:GHUV01040478.1.p1 GENE.GHUV01040478.1~~GHUV01040478.1.p1  ORF type:complete len:128 (-),score=24.38 GHUV01040478.1:65-448(-)
MRENGSLVAFETGQVTAYALETAQERGQMFCKPGDQVYEGQVVGVYNKAGDLKINVCKAKALTNMRASQSEKKVGLCRIKVLRCHAMCSLFACAIMLLHGCLTCICALPIQMLHLVTTQTHHLAMPE